MITNNNVIDYDSILILNQTNMILYPVWFISLTVDFQAEKGTASIGFCTIRCGSTSK